MGQEPFVELLAPAGNREGFYGAIHAGADAVYLGGERFGARAYADNFNTEELLECIRYAHLWGRKVYLAVNTLVKEREFGELYEYLKPYYEVGLDGVIVQDIGVFAFIRKHFPDMELHVSTQMTLTGVHGASLLKDMGACRIVPARELSLQELIHIKRETGLAIETFIHGAMCYCYSGQCLFSSILGGRSGNRGRCAQPCRLPYRVESGRGRTEECFPLSLKDMCTIEHIPELIEAGIDSFKIEGRMKKPEYAAGVTAIYRKFIDLYYSGFQKSAEKKAKWKIAPEDMDRLASLYIRSERQDGYYHKHNGRDMVTLNNPAYNGSDEALLGEIRRRYVEHRPRMPIDAEAVFTVGERAFVTFTLGDASVTVEGETVSPADRKPITRENIEKQLGKLGESVFEMRNLKIHVDESAFYPLGAINELRRKAVKGLEEELIRRNGFPVWQEAVLQAPVQESVNSGAASPAKEKEKSEKRPCNGFTLSLRTMEQMDAVLNFGNGWEVQTAKSDTHYKQESFDKACSEMESSDNNRIRNSRICTASIHTGRIYISRIYIDSDLFIKLTESVVSMCRLLPEKIEVVLALPYIIRKRDDMYFDKLFTLADCHQDIFSGVLVRSLDGMGMVRDKKYRGRVYTDAGFYIWNPETLKEWEPFISGFCLPFELKAAEQRALGRQEYLSGNISCEKIVYGRIPMMITANCVAKTTDRCLKEKGERTVRLIDRYQKIFPVELNCLHCMNIIYNSVPLSLHGELAKWKEQVLLRMDFTLESGEETRQILEFFTSAPTPDNPPFGQYTTGHEKRGVE